jgi:Uma2 family endonuclease
MSLDRFRSETDVSKLPAPERKLPTMYDLPSEYPGEPGVPDEFHILQPNLLTETFQPANYSPEQILCAMDMHLYYDATHTKWSKRPDWFAVVGVPTLYRGEDLRYSYVVWDEGANPLIVVELLSKHTKNDDLGRTRPGKKRQPDKWRTYEQILQIPYYVTIDRLTNEVKAFRLQAGRYVPYLFTDSGLWLEEVGLWLGMWSGYYRKMERLWLRWRDKDGNWIPTLEERAEQERMQKEVALQVAEQQSQLAQQQSQRADQEREEKQLLAAKLRELGIDPSDIIGKK